MLRTRVSEETTLEETLLEQHRRWLLWDSIVHPYVVFLPNAAETEVHKNGKYMLYYCSCEILFKLKDISPQ